MADRRQHAHDFTGLPLAEQLEPGPAGLVQKFEPALRRADTHDRQRPAHRQRRIAGDMREGAGHGFARRARRVDSQDELLAGPRVLREDAGILEKHAAAVALVTHCRTLIARSSIALRSSTPPTGRRCPCRRGGEDTRIGASPRAPTGAATEVSVSSTVATGKPERSASAAAKARALARNGFGAVPAGHAHDELRRLPVVEDAIDFGPGRPAIGAQRRERRGGANFAVCGGDAYATEPEIERDEDVAVATARHAGSPGVQACPA